MTEAIDSNRKPQDTRDQIERYCRLALTVAAGIAVLAMVYFGAVILIAPR